MRRKLTSFMLGLVLTLVGIELLLIFSQWAFTLYQTHDNQAAIERGEAEIRILAIGESTTAVAGDETGKLLVPKTAYPKQLETVLNERQSQINFRVFNVGMMGGTAASTLEVLETSIRQFDPDMIIAMMGIKDTPDQLLPGSSDLPKWLRALRTVQLGTWLLEGMRMRKDASITDVGPGDVLPAAIRPKGAQLGKYIKETRMTRDAPESAARADLEIAVYLWFIQRHNRSAALIRDIIERHDVGYNLLARVLATNGKNAEGRAMLAEAIQRHPDEGMYRNSLAELYIEAGLLDEADAVLSEAREHRAQFRSPKLVGAYLDLTEAWLARERGDYARAIAVLEQVDSKVRRTDTRRRYFPPVSMLWNGAMGETYMDMGNWEAAERYLSEAVRLHPGYHANMWMLSKVYRHTGRFDREKEVRKDLLTRTGRLAEYFEMAKLFRLYGHEDRIPGLMDEATQNIPSLQESYRRLYEIAQLNRVDLVVMQYPSFPVELVHKYAPQIDGVTFIDNEHVFDANPDGYFFEPKFPHSFSHYTVQGARVLAEHVADEVLGKYLPSAVPTEMKGAAAK